MYKAALFDLDGVVINTETQYSVFWSHIGETYVPELPDFANAIKGMTLVQIYDRFFAGKTDLQDKITAELNNFEKHMNYDYLPGFEDFMKVLKAAGVKTAVVTSSNQTKMQNVYHAHPLFQDLFDAILTSEDFACSKPDPDCYLKAAQRFTLSPADCVGFEDSINGLKAVEAAKMFCVGLATTNPRQTVAKYADIVIENYLDNNKIRSLFV